MESTPAEMQSFATVRSVFLWVQLIGDPLQELLNSLGVEVNDHPRVLVALSEVIGTLQSRSGPHLPSLRRRLKKPKRWCPGGGSLDNHWSIRGHFYLCLRAFGDGLALVGRFRLIMFYFACVEYVNFNFFVNFSGPVDAFHLWDPGGQC